MPENVGSADKATGTPAPTAAPAGPTPSAPSAPPSAVASLEKVSGAPAASSAAGEGGTGVPQSPTGAIVPSSPATPGEPDFWERIPEPRRNTILENARRETEARIRGEYSWLGDVTKDQAQQAFNVVRRLYSDPIGFITQIQSELRQHPDYASQFEPNPADDKWPDPDLRSEADPKTGEVKRAWSDASLSKILEIQERKLIRRFEQMVGPLQRWAEGRDTSDREASFRADIADTVSTVMTEARQLPHFKEHEKEIGEALGNIPEATRNRIGAVAALYQAYHQILQTKVFPGMSVKAEQDARDQLTRKAAAAAGSVHPNQGHPAVSSDKPKNVDELAKHMARMAGAAQ